jgi:hypothetical protein
MNNLCAYGDVTTDMLIRADHSKERRVTDKYPVWNLTKGKGNGQHCQRELVFDAPPNASLSDNMYLLIKLNVSSTTCSKSMPQEWFKTNKERMSAQFRTLFDEGKHTNGHDIELRCRDGSVWAHKVILRTRSSVFSNHLEFCERDKIDVISLDSESKDIVSWFIEWLYTGELTPEIDLNMLTQREKYSERITSIIQLYQLALQYESEDLMERLCVMIVRNGDHKTMIQMASMGKHTPAYRMLMEHWCVDETWKWEEGSDVPSTEMESE